VSLKKATLMGGFFFARAVTDLGQGFMEGVNGGVETLFN